MPKKFPRLFLCILALTITSLFFFMNLFINQNIIHYPINGNNKDIVFFSGHIFGTSIFGKTTKYNIFKTKFIEVGSTLLIPPQIVTSSKNQWTFLICKNGVSVYSKSKDEIYRVPVLGGNIISGSVSILNNKDKYNLLLLISNNKSKYADNLVVSSITEDSKGVYFKTLLKKTLTKLKPWKIQTCDVDGDGKYEISIGMYKTTPLSPVMAKRPFIYQWTGSDIAPKWLGSRLSKPFTDYIFGDINKDGKDEIISIETLRNKHKIISAYAWKGFGFELIGNSTEYQDVLGITRSDNAKGNIFCIIAKVKENSRTIFYTLGYKNGWLVPRGNR